ncbi:hypothetical protein D3C73_628130 [compost metagenome]
MLHHAAHFIKLLNQSIDISYRSTAAEGNPLTAVMINHVRILLLLLGHGMYNGFNTSHLLLIDLHVLELLNLTHPRNHIHNLINGAELLHLVHLLKEIVEGEFGVAHLALHFLGFLGINIGLGFLNEGKHIAHPENP